MYYYLHGYLSSPESTKGLLFKKNLNAHPLKYRDCKPKDLKISECIKNIQNEIQDDNDVVLIGSSLGGFLAIKTALINSNVKKLILLNPACIPLDYDLNMINDMPMSILVDMQDKKLFEEKINADILVIIGTNDDVVSNKWPIDFAKAQEATVVFLHDDHRFLQNIERLPAIIKAFLDKKS